MEKTETLKENGVVPLYYQLKDRLLERIENGEWGPNQPLPAEKDLCQEYGVSVGTVRRAMDELVRAGLLYRKQGRGTFVLPPRIEVSLDKFISFSETVKGRGYTLETKILDAKVIHPTSYETNLLKIAADEEVISILRLRFVNEEPTVFQKVYLPHKVCPGLIDEDLGATPLYELLTEKYGIVLVSAEQFIEPVVVDEYEASMLGISRGSPAFLVVNITYTEGNRPIVLSKDIVRGDRYRYRVELRRDPGLERRG